MNRFDTCLTDNESQRQQHDEIEDMLSDVIDIVQFVKTLCVTAPQILSFSLEISLVYLLFLLFGSLKITRSSRTQFTRARI